ncbi:MAG: barstar family protein [Planctomycetota bacterium]
MTSANHDTGFLFYAERFDDLVIAQDPTLLVARVSSRIRQKFQLFQILKTELKLPDYFGSNWDALEECLRDFSWLEGVRGVQLIHAGLPFPEGHHSRGVYLQILRDAVKSWTADPKFQFEVLFPERNRGEILRLLRTS